MKTQTIAALAAMACAWQLAAQPFTDPPRPPNLNFEQAANLALAARPELARFAAERALHISERETAALKPALELNLALENAFGTGTYSAAATIVGMPAAQQPRTASSTPSGGV